MNILGQAEAIAGGWDQFGLAGMVIGALFVTVYFLARYWADKHEKIAEFFGEKIDKISERHEAVVTALDENHRSERREWQQEAIRRETALQSMVADVTATLREMKKE